MWRREITILGAGLLCFGLVLAAHGTSNPAAAAPSGQAAAATGRAIVEVATPSLPPGKSVAARRSWRNKRERAADILTRVSERNRLQVVSRIPETGQLTVRLGAGGIEGLRRRVGADPRVESVTADQPLELRYTPNDFAFGRHDFNAPADDFYQWNLIRSRGPGAWNLSKGLGAEVAVIDTGAYTAHPDLSGRIAGRLNCVDGCGGTDVSDPDGHGTHVAGLACANSDNTYGIASLGFDCNLFIIKIFTLVLGQLRASCSDAAAAVVQAGNRRSEAISMSLGGPCGEMTDELEYARARGSILVAAGANDPTPSPTNNYPAQWLQPRGTGPDVNYGRGLVVTSAKYNGTRSSFAQRDTGVSVAAYGSASNAVSGGQQGILSTWPAGISCGSSCVSLNGDSRFAYLVGTSMAAPQVSGLVALMRSVRPTLAPSSLIRLIKLTASHCGGYRNGIGWGIINADRAVTATLGRDVTAPTSRVKKLKGKKARRARKRKGIRLLKLKRSDQAQVGCDREARSSGVRKINVFVSRNGKRYRRLTKTKRKRVKFRPKKKGKYRFISRAVDHTGNREPWPPKADIKVKVKRVKKKARRR